MNDILDQMKNTDPKKINWSCSTLFTLHKDF